jgi:tetratricopeptide (TPR) repeat protein
MTKETLMSNHQKITITLFIFLLCLLTFLSFLPVLKNGFVNWDDQAYITDNPLIKQLSLKGMKNIFFSFHVGLYKPLVLLSFALEYHFFKLNPFIYHLDNLLLHLLNALLVFWFIYRLSLKLPVAFLSAVFFAIHPLRVESVAWVVERKDMLYGLFLLLSLISYLYYIDKGQRQKYYNLSVAGFFLSLLAKPAGLMLPFALLTLDWFRKRKLNLQTFKEKIPYLVLSLLAVGLNSYAQYLQPDSQLNLQARTGLTLPDKFLIANRAILLYLEKLFLPIKLSCLYPYPQRINHLLPPGFRIAPLIVLLLALVVGLSRRYTPKVIFGSLFFFILLFPLLPLISTGPAFAAERYSYIACLGLFYLLAEASLWLYLRASPPLKTTIIISLSLIILILALLTFQRTRVWKDSLTLWDDCLRNYPHTALAYNNRGTAYQSQAKPEQALADYNQAIRLGPDYAEAYYNRGNAYYYQGKFEQAILNYNQAIRLDPYLAIAYNNRGSIYRNQGQPEQAIADYNQSIKLKADNAQAYYNRGLVYQEQGKFEQAILNYNQAIRLDPDYALAYNNRGNVYKSQSRLKQALADYEQAIKIDPALAIAYNNRAVAYFLSGEYQLAQEDIAKAKALGYQVNPQFLEELSSSQRK